MVKHVTTTMNGQMGYELSDDYFLHMSNGEIAAETGLELTLIQKMRETFDKEMDEKSRPIPQPPKISLMTVYFGVMFIVVILFLAHVFSQPNPSSVKYPQRFPTIKEPLIKIDWSTLTTKTTTTTQPNSTQNDRANTS